MDFITFTSFYFTTKSPCLVKYDWNLAIGGNINHWYQWNYCFTYLELYFGYQRLILVWKWDARKRHNHISNKETSTMHHLTSHWLYIINWLYHNLELSCVGHRIQMLHLIMSLGINGGLFYSRIHVPLELDVWKNIWTKTWLTNALKYTTKQQHSLC